jgi:hypothetical protein
MRGRRSLEVLLVLGDKHPRQLVMDCHHGTDPADLKYPATSGDLRIFVLPSLPRRAPTVIYV